MKQPVTTREHVNVNGRVPAIAVAAATFLRSSYRPRIIPGALGGTASLVISGMNTKGITRLRAELDETGWPFIHDRPVRAGGWHSITMLVTL